MIHRCKTGIKFYFSFFILCFLLFSCKTTQSIVTEPEEDSLTLIFGGDIMAHTVNYSMKDYSKIWKDVEYFFSDADFSFGNIESPMDYSKPASTYPNFNMPQSYVEAAINTGFNVFSLCNNHTNDQFLTGIQHTQETADKLQKKYLEQGRSIYFSGLRADGRKEYTWNLIEKDNWKILFLPVTEILNRPDYSSFINYVPSNEKNRKAFIEYCRNLKNTVSCDLFIISIHADETEYTRNISDSQNAFYQSLLDCGADVIWANHAHIIKDRKFFINMENQSAKIIMYANGNTISGQRSSPDFESSWPEGERDNTGDGLLYKFVYTKEKEKKDSENTIIHLKKAEPLFITSYINTAGEIVLKPLNQSFVDYLQDVPRKNWADYVQKRIKINRKSTKDIVIWQ